MNLILVSVGNFQSYIIDNIKQLLKLQIKNIYVITDKIYFDNFKIFKNKSIELVDSNKLFDEYNYYDKTMMNKTFRNGFWTLTSLRFFYIYALMRQYNLSNCIHIENDVLLYHNIDILETTLNNNFMYIPFDTYRRNIASIMYIPNHELFKQILDCYDVRKNDMDNFCHIKRKTGLIKNFPIGPINIANTDEKRFVCDNYESFNFIFDAAAMGQYLGGVDPRNIPGDSTGFINETCCIKYNEYKFEWINKKPYLLVDNDRIPIFNLHIHCKNLKKFM
jgi:hypothetical protein